ncbi:uncharacterized protein [Nicotiana tomentosiformis]|uniref:uncharacterized protein n=1 Tax=Nicotiana tomentosiformis TaxID=4098 RepID=UPI00388C8947
MDQIQGAPPVLKGPDSKKYTQLLYKPSTEPELIPKQFKISDVPMYDGTSDPHEHITTYTIAVKGNDLAPHEIDSILLMKFGETLTKGTLTRYSLLPEHSIDSFEMLVDSFIKAHVGAIKVQVQNANIFRIVQGESKSLREFVRTFQKERMLISAIPDEWAAETFTKGFLASVKGQGREKNKEKLKDDFDTDRRSSRSRFFHYERDEGRGRGFRSAERFATDRRTDQGQNNKSLQNKETSDFSYPRFYEYKFNVILVELVSAMRNIKEAEFPKPMRSDPSHRDPNLWCKYHRTNGHRTGDYRHLLEEVAILLKNSHLKECLSNRDKSNYGRNYDNAEPSKAGEYPHCMMINMICWGNEINGVTFSVAKS